MANGDNGHEPYFGQFGASIITAIATGIISVIVLVVATAPEKAENNSQKRHSEQQQRIDELREELESIRRTVTELSVKVENGTKDRFTGEDFLREDRRYSELRAADRDEWRSSIESLRKEIKDQWNYKLTERRWQEFYEKNGNK